MRFGECLKCDHTPDIRFRRTNDNNYSIFNSDISIGCAYATVFFSPPGTCSILKEQPALERLVITYYKHSFAFRCTVEVPASVCMCYQTKNLRSQNSRPNVIGLNRFFLITEPNWNSWKIKWDIVECSEWFFHQKFKIIRIGVATN